MKNVINIDKQSRIPVYEQLIDSLKREILNSFIEEEEMIPSVRTLAMELSINPNTIQKAYNELERLGITQSVPGVGRYVSKGAIGIIKKEIVQKEYLLKDVVTELKSGGYSLDEIMEIVRKYYKGEGKL